MIDMDDIDEKISAIADHLRGCGHVAAADLLESQQDVIRRGNATITSHRNMVGVNVFLFLMNSYFALRGWALP